MAIKEVKEESSKGLPAGQPFIQETPLESRAPSQLCLSRPEGSFAVHISIIDFLHLIVKEVMMWPRPGNDGRWASAP